MHVLVGMLAVNTASVLRHCHVTIYLHTRKALHLHLLHSPARACVNSHRIVVFRPKTFILVGRVDNVLTTPPRISTITTT